MGTVDDLFGVAAHQDASHSSVPPAPHDQQSRILLLAQLDDLVGGASSPEMGSRDGASGLLDLPYLLIEYLLALALELPLYEGVGVGGWHVVPDVDEVELRAGPAREIGRRLAGLGSVLGAVGGQQDLRRKHAHLGLLLRSKSVMPLVRILPTSRGSRHSQAPEAAGSRNWRR